MMRPTLLIFCGVFAAMLIAGELPAHAQRHRATHLGNPEHRFAPPLTKPDQVRKLFANEKLKADVDRILDYVEWRGDHEDLRRAAATAEITEVRLPKGTRMPFMSTRHGGKAVALIDVGWFGEKPVEAYAFTFTSRGRAYRVVVPKPCSNFYVEDKGPTDEPQPVAAKRPVISLHFEVVDIEDPVQVGENVIYDLKILNQSPAPITNLKMTCSIPESESYVSGSGVTPIAQNGQFLKMGTLPVIEGNGTVTWRVIVKAVAVGDTRFRADLMCDQLERPITRFEATQLIP
jgi:uncharacterized repeat protein (TIGR01451 family)